MNQLSTISWPTFFIACAVLLLTWLWTSRTKQGRLLVEHNSPWTASQWKRVLIVLVLTLFILINPIFHLLAAGILVGLYYLFVGRNFMSLPTSTTAAKEDRSLFTGNKIESSASFILTCLRNDDSNQLDARQQLDRCLFSFPFIRPHTFPKIQYVDGIFEVEVDLDAAAHLDSLIHYIKASGFDIKQKNNH
jgi:hypothetical protein